MVSVVNTEDELCHSGKCEVRIQQVGALAVKLMT